MKKQHDIPSRIPWRTEPWCWKLYPEATWAAPWQASYQPQMEQSIYYHHQPWPGACLPGQSGSSFPWARSLSVIPTALSPLLALSGLQVCFQSCLQQDRVQEEQETLGKKENVTEQVIGLECARSFRRHSLLRPWQGWGLGRIVSDFPGLSR